MEEIKPMKVDDKVEEKPLVEEVKEKKPLVEEIKELKQFKNEVIAGNLKTSKMRIPRKARVRKRHLKRGYIGILRIDENKNITGEKQRISGSAYTTSDGITHALNLDDIVWWEGRFPIIWQPSWRNNPVNFLKGLEKNETHGQPYIKAKMLADVIKVKAKGGSIVIWFVVAGVALFAINYLTGGSLFG